MTYEVKVFFSGISILTNDLADSLYQYFSDGTIVSSEGIVKMIVDREATSYEAAVDSVEDDLARWMDVGKVPDEWLVFSITA